jgi:hypothetical protein
MDAAGAGAALDGAAEATAATAELAGALAVFVASGGVVAASFSPDGAAGAGAAGAAGASCGTRAAGARAGPFETNARPPRIDTAMIAATKRRPFVAREPRARCCADSGSVEWETGSVLVLARLPSLFVVASWCGVSRGLSNVSALGLLCGADAVSVPDAVTSEAELCAAAELHSASAPSGAPGAMLRSARGVRGIVAAGDGRSSSAPRLGCTGVGAAMPIKVALRGATRRSAASGKLTGAGALVRGALLGVAAAGGCEADGRGGLETVSTGRGGELGREGALLGARGGALLVGRGGTLLVR